MITSGGYYYVYNIGAKAFLDHGGNYNSQAIVFTSSTGGSLINPVQSGSLWILQYEDKTRTLYRSAADANGWVYTDGTTTTSNTWDIQISEATNNIYAVQCPNTYSAYNVSQYLGASSSLYSSNRGSVYDVRYNKTASDYTKWIFCTSTAVAKYSAKVKLDRYMSIARLVRGVDLSAYINIYENGSTSEINQAAIDLNTVLNPTNKTSLINNPDFTLNATTGWTITTGTVTTANTNAQAYRATFDINQTVTGLSAGIYIIKVQGYERQVPLSTNAQTAYNNGFDILASRFYATVTGAGTTSFVPLRSIYTETSCATGTTIGSYKYPNNQSNANDAFTAGLYENELGYIIVDETGSLKIGISSNYQATDALGQWHCFDNFRLYYYGPVNITYSGEGNWSNASNWSSGSVPTSVNNVTVSSGALTIDQNASVNKITVAPGAKLTLPEGKTLTASNLILQSDANGIATFVDNGTSAITTANVQQYMTGSRNWYVSIPVSLATTANLSYGSSVVYWDEPSGSWKTAATGSTLSPLQGYISVGSSSTTTSGNISFSGELNTGAKSITLTRQGTSKSGFNLVGNPYPSYLNAMTAINNAGSAAIEPTIWYRTKGTGYTFETVNTTNGVGTNNSGTALSGYIPPMQALWVRALVDSTILSFNNSMRSHAIAGITTTLRSATDELQQKVLRLKVSNRKNSDEAIVVYNKNADDGYDAFDSHKMSNDNVAVPEIYTLAGTEHVAINGFSRVEITPSIALGFKTGQVDTFAIKVTEMTNFGPDTRVLLLDNEASTVSDLTDGSSYNFSSETANTTSRFTVMLKSASITTGIAQLKDSEITIQPNQTGQITVMVNGTRAQIPTGTLTFTDILGKTVQRTGLTGTTTVVHSNLPPGVYLITVDVEGKLKTQKIVIK